MKKTIWIGLLAGGAGLVVGGYFAGRSAGGAASRPQPAVNPLPAAGMAGLETGPYAAPMIEPTAAVPLKRMITPWEPHRALVLAMNADFLREDGRRFELYLQIIRAAIDYVDVIVMVPRFRSDVESRLLDRFERDPTLAKARERVSFLSSSISSVWVRDYMPQYALDRSGGLVVLDARAIGLTTDPAAYFRGAGAAPTADKEPFARRLAELLGDDLAPGYLGSFLRSEYGFPVRMVRPPLALDGGDFVPLGTGELAVSGATLRYNGGQDDGLRALLREYYGARKVHILTTLPGRTVDHLDFILQGVGEKVILTARPPRPAPARQLYANMLGQRVTAVLQRNLEYLRRNLPGHRIIEVPMPPALSATPEEIRGEIRARIEHRICEAYGIDYAALMRAEADASQKQAESALDRVLRERFGAADLGQAADLDRVTRKVLGESLEELERLHVDELTVYRTYLNSTVIRSKDGRTLVLLPRYAARTEAESTMIPAMEAEVMAAYREALPGARLEWIDCDPIIDEQGALHCITHLVPWVDPRPDGSSR